MELDTSEWRKSDKQRKARTKDEIKEYDKKRHAQYYKDNRDKILEQKRKEK